MGKESSYNQLFPAQVTNYYSSGMVYKSKFPEDGHTSIISNNYLYNSKELDLMHGLNRLDYGARWYDPVIARWSSMDPLAEKYYSISPYAYCANNPVKYIDPDGRGFETVWDIASLVMGASSFVDNVQQGNTGAAVVDAVGIVVDAIAAVIPVVPGGVGAGIKAARSADDAVKAVNTATDAGSKMKTLKKTAETGQEAHRQIQKELMDKIPGTKKEVPVTIGKKNLRKMLRNRIPLLEKDLPRNEKH